MQIKKAVSNDLIVHNDKVFHTDFFCVLPKYMTDQVISLIKRYSNTDWFKPSFDEYREMVLDIHRKDLPSPNKYFGTFIKDSNDILEEPKKINKTRKKRKKKND